MELINFINDLADSFKLQLDSINQLCAQENKDAYTAAVKDDIIMTAIVMQKHIPDFDFNAFYSRAWYPGTHPIHI